MFSRIKRILVADIDSMNRREIFTLGVVGGIALGAIVALGALNNPNFLAVMIGIFVIVFWVRNRREKSRKNKESE
jgi:hypothetical protein